MTHHGNHTTEIDPHELGHMLPFKMYLNIFLALVVLTIITVAASHVDFGAGWANVVIAMLIASVKAGLVALFFMHLKYENPITWLYVAFPILLIFIMLAGVFVDNPNRGSDKHIQVSEAAR